MLWYCLLLTCVAYKLSSTTAMAMPLHTSGVSLTRFSWFVAKEGKSKVTSEPNNRNITGNPTHPPAPSTPLPVIALLLNPKVVHTNLGQEGNTSDQGLEQRAGCCRQLGQAPTRDTFEGRWSREVSQVGRMRSAHTGQSPVSKLFF